MYRFTRAEFVWGLLVAVLPPVLLALSTLDPEAVTDYRVWAASVVAAVIRAAGGYGLSFLARANSGDGPE